MATKAPRFELTVDSTNIKNDFGPILRHIQPNWRLEEVKFEESEKSVATGLVNTMIKCYRLSDPLDAIMIRIKNTTVQAKNLSNPKTEISFIEYFHEKDCAPNILAVFANGFCYEYIHGEVLNKFHLKEEHIWKLIAEELAIFHSGSLKDKSIGITGEVKMSDLNQKLWEIYPKNFEDPEQEHRFKVGLPDKEILRVEFVKAQEEYLSTKPDIALSHNDVRAENIIWNKKTGKLHVVDFEVMNYNFQTYDLAHHFGYFTGCDNRDYSLYPDKKFQLKWLRHYLKKFYECTNRNFEDVSEKDVLKLYVQVNKHYLFQLITLAVAGPAFSSSMPDLKIDLLQCGIEAYVEYLKLKDELLALKMPA